MSVPTRYELEFKKGVVNNASPEASGRQEETRNMDNKIPPPRLLGTGMQAGGSPILSTHLKDGMTTDSTGQPVP